MADLTRCNAELDELLSCVESPKVAGADEELFCGLDVGTAFIVLVAVDGEGHPRGCAYQFADVVRDGMVVDYMGACDIARSLREKLESQLGCELSQCAVALPPGTESLDGGVVKNVAESAGLDVTAVFDEPTAANFLIGATDAAVVDIGGGTTGISIVEGGKVVESVDESTGGTHFSLVLAGAKGVSFDEAELFKRDPANHAEVLPIVRPTIDKVASIIRRCVERHGTPEVVLVGGTAELAGIEQRVEKVLGLPATKPNHPMFVTPMGIALGCLQRAKEDAGDGR